jgi:hypothetical protein
MAMLVPPLVRSLLVGSDPQNPARLHREIADDRGFEVNGWIHQPRRLQRTIARTSAISGSRPRDYPHRPILSRVRCIAWFNIPRLWRLQWQQSRTMDHSKHSDVVAENFVDHAIRSFYDLADGRIPVLGDRLTRKREGADLSSAGSDAIHHS